MSRPLRIEFARTLCHVTSRGDDQERGVVGANLLYPSSPKRRVSWRDLQELGVREFVLPVEKLVVAQAPVSAESLLA